MYSAIKLKPILERAACVWEFRSAAAARLLLSLSSPSLPPPPSPLPLMPFQMMTMMLALSFVCVRRPVCVRPYVARALAQMIPKWSAFNSGERRSSVARRSRSLFDRDKARERTTATAHQHIQQAYRMAATSANLLISI